ncbi:MAG TPA: redoxin domain-containing protein [Candidatus Sulfotelmatobacter sp.]|nr:redoxin domain-containing protein [Candidatus Sulfotelmatobacter sp.]
MNPFRTGISTLLLAGALLFGSAPANSCGMPADDPDSGAELIGRPAPSWSFTRWVGAPLSLEKLRGKVVLMRWWNVDCHYCEATLPEIEALRTRYQKDGLVVIGVFHPKPPHPVKDADVKRAAEERGFHGPLAIDEQWTTLSRYWLAGHPERNWTSVSFLIDREGKICWVQGGGEYHHSTDPRHARCDLVASDLEARLARMFGRNSATTETSSVH